MSIWESPWFSVEVTKSKFPWVYEKGDKPSLVISTLEALAVMKAVKLRYGQGEGKENSKVMVVPRFQITEETEPHLINLCQLNSHVLPS